VNGDFAVGGLVGALLGEVSNCYSVAAVTGNVNAGGLVGLVMDWIWNAGTVTRSYSAGPVSGNENAGGLVGKNNGTVSAGFWDITKSGHKTSDGGTGKPTGDLTKKATFTGLDFAGTWDINEKKSYPFLWSIDRTVQASWVSVDASQIPAEQKPQALSGSLLLIVVLLLVVIVAAAAGGAFYMRKKRARGDQAEAKTSETPAAAPPSGPTEEQKKQAEWSEYERMYGKPHPDSIKAAGTSAQQPDAAAPPPPEPGGSTPPEGGA
jgi:hypothetical protein